MEELSTQLRSVGVWFRAGAPKFTRIPPRTPSVHDTIQTPKNSTAVLYKNEFGTSFN